MSWSLWAFSWQLEFVMEVGSELDCGVVGGVGGHMEFHSDGIYSELWFRNIPEMVSKDCVPLHPPPLQGSDVSALLTMVFKKGWH